MYLINDCGIFDTCDDSDIAATFAKYTGLLEGLLLADFCHKNMHEVMVRYKSQSSHLA